ncbi:MAG: putative peptidoglycan glycosyltransferase FtsW [Patescibacteria group bacterium]|jgi:cell division protein FtsW
MKRFHFKQSKKKLTSRLNLEKILGKPDYFLLGIFGLITVFGLIMLSSASAVESYRNFGSTYYLFWHQVVSGFIPGVAFFFVFAAIPYRRLEKYTVWFFIISLILLLLVFLPGIGSNNGSSAKSWINVFGLFSFQPAEIVKLFLILGLAGWFSYRGRELNNDFWNGLVPFAVILGLISLLVVMQPDLGTLIIIVSISLAVYFTAGARFTHILWLILGGLAAFGILVIQAPYRAARLLTFLNPKIDPQGIGYHINQAFLAIGSGGFFGLGFGQSRQKFAYLPEVMGDSIFAIIAEELGFIFAVALIGLFILLAWRGLKLAQAVSDDYARFVIIGITSWFVLQAFFNIAAMIGLMPLTGIPLPFVSYGGTALAASLAAVGILANISREIS